MTPNPCVTAAPDARMRPHCYITTRFSPRHLISLCAHLSPLLLYNTHTHTHIPHIHTHPRSYKHTPNICTFHTHTPHTQKHPHTTDTQSTPRRKNRKRDDPPLIIHTNLIPQESIIPPPPTTPQHAHHTHPNPTSVCFKIPSQCSRTPLLSVTSSDCDRLFLTEHSNAANHMFVISHLKKG